MGLQTVQIDRTGFLIWQYLMPELYQLDQLNFSLSV